MKLIEKKCPNCGAALEFNESDKSCKCDYCHRSFEIERDQSVDVSDIAEQFNLNELNGPLKIFSIFSGAVMITIFIMTFLIIGGVGYGIYKANSQPNEELAKNFERRTTLLSDASKLDKYQIESLNMEARIIAHQTAKGRSDTTYSYQSSDSLRLEKIYIAFKKDSNKIIIVYKGKFHNFFDQSDVHTIYTPVVYENVHEIIDLNHGKNPAPEYYFNADKSSYIYAYGSLDEINNNLIKPLEDDNYKITET